MVTQQIDIANFSQLQAQYHLYCEQKEYQLALQLIRREYNRFAEAKPLLMRWCIGLFAQMGQEQRALAALEAAIADRQYYREAKLRHDADLQSLRLNSRFRALSTQSGTLYEEQKRHVRPEVLVLPPQTPPPWPMLVVLHEHMGNVETVRPYWHTAVEEGWLVAFVQSNQLGWATGHYVWDEVEPALTQLQAQIESLPQQYPIQPKQIVVAGHGQGGAIAQKLVSERDTAVRGVVLVEGWTLDTFKQTHLLLSHQPRPRYYLLASQNLPGQIFDYYEEAHKLARQLGRMGFLCRVEGLTSHVPGLPTEMAPVVRRALHFVSVPDHMQAD